MAASRSAATTITFWGATETVTGSRFLVEDHGGWVLVDWGLFQGVRRFREMNWEPFPVDPSTIDAVVLTHAHIDHSGYLPALVREDPWGTDVPQQPDGRRDDVDWLSGVPVPPSAVSIVHGEQVAADTLRRRLRDELGWRASVPSMGQAITIWAPRPGSVRPGP